MSTGWCGAIGTLNSWGRSGLPRASMRSGDPRRRAALVVIAAGLTLGACGGKSDSSQAAQVDPSGGTASFTDTTLAGEGGGMSSASMGGGTSATAQAEGGTATASSSSVLLSCGNAMIDPGEACDDGNTTSGDGCSKDCHLEDMDPCLRGGCRVTVVCGDASLGPGEACDDGNNRAGDGCSEDCSTVEPPYVCPIPGRACLLWDDLLGRCGNGAVEPEFGEQCDDGSLNGQVGYCPWDCAQTGLCGNGILEPWNGEGCDDGSLNGQYGSCGSNCSPGAYCGDSIVNGPEICDYGKLNVSATAAEYGSCLDNCQLGPHCGDGIVQVEYEQCDLGADLNGKTSACSWSCKDYLPIVD